jgi:hypothetical protein
MEREIKEGKTMAGQYNEPYEKLSKKTKEVHRAYLSLIEEIEAMDWWCRTHIPIYSYSSLLS